MTAGEAKGIRTILRSVARRASPLLVLAQVIWYLAFLISLPAATPETSSPLLAGRAAATLGLLLILLGAGSFATALADGRDGALLCSLILGAAFLHHLFGATLFPFAAHYLVGAMVAVLLPLPASILYSALLVLVEVGPLLLSGAPAPLAGLLPLAGVLAVLSLAVGLYTGMERREKDRLVQRHRRLDAGVRELTEIDHDPRGAGVQELSPEARWEATATSLIGLEDELNDLLALCRTFTSAGLVLLYWHEGDGGGYYLRSFSGELDPSNIPHLLAAEEGPVGWVLRQGEPLCLNDEAGVGNRVPFLLGDDRLTSVLLEPVHRGAAVVGLLVLGCLGGPPLGPREGELGRAVARQAGRMVDIASKLTDFEESVKTWINLGRAARAMTGSLREEKVIEEVMTLVGDLIPCDGALLVVRRNGEAQVAASRNAWDALPPGTVLSPGRESWFGRLWEEGSLQTFGDLGRHGVGLPLLPDGLPQPKAQSFLGVPLLSEETVVGALLLVDHRSARFSKSLVDRLLILTAPAALAIQNSQLHATIETMSVTDALTALPNRRFFNERLPEEFERLLRRPGTLSLIMVDIDRFKSINDRYGHPFGDTVLKGVAACIEGILRKTDLSARIGGEEFALLLIDTDQEGAVAMAGRLAEQLRRISFPASGGPLSITVSQGIATSGTIGTPEDAAARRSAAGTPEELIRRADAALYRAKESGRNRFCVAPRA